MLEIIPIYDALSKRYLLPIVQRTGLNKPTKTLLTRTNIYPTRFNRLVVVVSSPKFLCVLKLLRAGSALSCQLAFVSRAPVGAVLDQFRLHCSRVSMEALSYTTILWVPIMTMNQS